jgi:mono/diheme cytochrome c family protein
MIPLDITLTLTLTTIFMQRTLKTTILFCIGLALLPLPVLRASQQAAPVDFAREIEPIFRAACVACHFGDKAKGELRLDSKAAAMKGGISGAVILPGNSRDSRLLQRLRGLNGERRMPLGGESLAPAQIELIRRWIDEGAAWPEPDSAIRNSQSAIAKHWAFVAPVRPAAPAVRDRAWGRTPIDAFVLARLEREGLRPAPEADRVTLLRRLSLDLIGLPPTPEDVDRFLADRSPNAYEKQVERLLASPHYGERWGRLWLDAARYADSDGYEKDKPRRAWYYRDWVIQALNADKPYDQFIIEQIAGDLLPDASQEQIVATGYLRNSMVNEEGGIDPEEFRIEAMFDRMDAVGKGILGLTIQCAQCHNHKFDPIRQDEYYRMFAFLNNAHEAAVAVYTPEEQMTRAGIIRRTREIETELQHRTPDWPEQMAAWEVGVRNNQPQWTIVQPVVDDISTDGTRYLPQPDGSFLIGGYAPVKHRVKMQIKTDLRNIAAVRLELLTDPTLPLGGPGRSYKGTGALTEFEVEAAPASDPKKKTKLRFARATADLSLPERALDKQFDDQSGKHRVVGPVEFAIDGRDDTAWTTDAGPGLSNQPRKAVFAFDQPLANEAGAILTFSLSQRHGGWNNNDNQQNSLGRIRLSLTTAPNAAADPLPAGVRDLLAVPQARRTPAQTQAVFSYWRTTVAAWRAANEEIAALWRRHPEGASQLVYQERAQMRETFTLKRGDFLRPEKKITPDVPAFLHPLPPGAEPNRLTFARWLVDRRAPTTARSLVNRIWQSYFGTGLVATSEDLGRQSDAPSHPELLDWLAVELMEPSIADCGLRIANCPGNPRSKAWSLKHLHRLVVTSAVYRQSSKTRPALVDRDPANRLLARGPRLRVDAEIVRDLALAVSGLLNPTIGGPSRYPPIPEFLLLPPVSYGTKVWREETGENRYRRAIYTHRYRSVPYPALAVFDAPAADAACVRRARSNTPLQALATLNETLFVESARALALKTLQEGGPSDAARLHFAFRRVLARRPTLQESTELLGLLQRQRRRFIAGELNPWNLATAEPDKPAVLPKGVTMEDAAAWTAVSRVLFNLDETITKE